MLAERARAAEDAGLVPSETIAEMQEAGFFKVLQPKRWGGFEMHPNVFFEVQKALAEAAKSGDVDRFKGAPFHAPMKRLDETRAARSPVLRWTAPEGSNIAAE